MPSATCWPQNPQAKIAGVAGAMQQARLIKTQRESALLRRASHIVDIGHITRRIGAGEGRTYLRCGRNQVQNVSGVGHEIPVTGELVTGPRSCTVAYPNGRVPSYTEPGDAALMDISPRVDCYWSDCTNTLLSRGGTDCDAAKICQSRAGGLRGRDGYAPPRKISL